MNCIACTAIASREDLRQHLSSQIRVGSMNDSFHARGGLAIHNLLVVQVMQYIHAQVLQPFNQLAPIQGL